MVTIVSAVAIAGKALQIKMLAAKPLGKVIPIESIGGVTVANVLALLGLALFCFVAGLIARSDLGKTVHARRQVIEEHPRSCWDAWLPSF